jgi:hypothetical protein
MAIDLVNSKGWFRINGGNWDGSGTDNPATNTGGINIATLFPTNAAYALFCANNNAAGVTANFGTSAFSFTVPSGFSAWGAADVPAFAVPTAAFPRVACAITPITWDPTTALNTTLSSGNLVATNTGTTGTNQGVAGPAASAKFNVGKYYFEIKLTTFTGGNGVGLSIGPTGSAITSMSTSPPANAYTYFLAAGEIWGNGGGHIPVTLETATSGDIICIAIDCGNGRVWFRKNGGLWDNTSGHNPSIGDGSAGGFTFTSASLMVPFATYGNGLVGSGGASGNVFTANFGASAFSFAVPSGYTLGWPV